MISRGNSKIQIEFTGGVLLLISFVLAFLLSGFKGGVTLVLAFWICITPLVKLLMRKIERKLYGHYLEMEKKLVQKRNISVEELEKSKNKTDIEILEELIPGSTKESISKGKIYNE